ncbi:PSD1 and planctomycete cytochrome C domain-containing protein [Anatilimnocola floriformis]|uniref:PSD1 and planctomycete cytochrome C domain-containing protein n=1 Tax=Anatilimnocola floriformis TaxID=2948575 RepID=UPI0020C41125|nr:PSD1 and planctomycete cytochrome C domain-containing protein [Anatilimnocola floriformis]
MARRALGCCLLLLLCSRAAIAEQPFTANDYAARIKPVLKERCFACHGALKQEGSLRVDSVANLLKGGDSGSSLKASDVAASLLLNKITAKEESERMPPEGEPLKPAEIEAIRAWIAAGSPAPENEQAERDPRDHWAFKAPIKAPLPMVKNEAWAKNPIDAFIAAEHDKRGIVPQKPTDKRLWLRRVTLDLIGLPPTSEEMGAFLADDSATAHDKVVDGLLQRPEYGERWGRHLMDIYRYSDWWGLGAEVRNSQKHIWHWRDWIIESLNADKPYDQMIRESLAADELYPNDLDKLRGSGFLARQYFKFNRTSWLDETVEHTGKAFLGLTFNCAKCHDHKYDPFSQVEYYQMRAIFEPYQIRTDVVGDELDFEKNGIPRPFDCNLDAVTHLHIRGDDRNPDKTKTITPQPPAFLSVGEFAIHEVKLPHDAHQPGLRAHVIAAQRKSADNAITAARAALTAAQAKHAEAPDDQKAKSLLEVVIAERAFNVAEASVQAFVARLAADEARFHPANSEDPKPRFIEAAAAEKEVAVRKAEEEVARAELALHIAAADKKAEPEKKLAAAKTALEAAMKNLAAPGEAYTSLVGSLKTLESNLEQEPSRKKPFPTTSTGRRTALAQWITDPQHPLTSRVIVNHVWNRHFGRALVPTVFDFGRKGTPPTHPELLDWLAVELRERNWSLKHLHRLICTSQTYRLNSSTAGATAETLAADPDNKFYWRASPLRMEAQLVRDGLLHLAGELDLKQGGPSIPVADANSKRRSLYFVHSHNEHQQFLQAFDDANVLECYRRSESIVPQQALALENSPLATAMTEKIGAKLQTANPQASDAEFVRTAFLLILATEPKQSEIDLVLGSIAQLTDIANQKKLPNAQQHARIQIIHALLNHNDFVTIR